MSKFEGPATCRGPSLRSRRTACGPGRSAAEPWDIKTRLRIAKPVPLGGTGDRASPTQSFLSPAPRGGLQHLRDFKPRAPLRFALGHTLPPAARALTRYAPSLRLKMSKLQHPLRGLSRLLNPDF